jgi:hypothetical protein
LEVAECSIGTGATCGSVFLNQRFERALRIRFGRNADSILTPRRLEGAMRLFDTVIKRNYNPLDPGASKEYEVPIAGVSDMPDIGFEDGYLNLSESVPFLSVLTIGSNCKIFSNLCLIQSFNL